jgi:hypothetical protein
MPDRLISNPTYSPTFDEITIAMLIREAKPSIGTYWLMIPVVDRAVLESVKKLLVMKSEFR